MAPPPPTEIRLRQLDQDLDTFRVWWQRTETDPIPKLWNDFYKEVWGYRVAWEREDFHNERNTGKLAQKKGKAEKKYRSYLGSFSCEIGTWLHRNIPNDRALKSEYWTLGRDDTLPPYSPKRDDSDDVLPAYKV
ncbi:uncharacterized protein PAC_07637 [Phialocephala subalpina]|uniref:Uncharacterized protein n=1 Tax=Phialocephala subalpina TaxID=576137 RepID=A0A1L7WYB0_9HELO|nr:uncharacterized protein PAC_07637 [Phialocephala subalpina]